MIIIGFPSFSTLWISCIIISQNLLKLNSVMLHFDLFVLFSVGFAGWDAKGHLPGVIIKIR
jgi:hypothetical protein